MSNRFITSHERSLFQNIYGTQRQRLGKDSLRDYDQCSICLNPIVQAMSCNKGHIYCKECILKNLIDQKKENKLKIKEWELRQLKLKREENTQLIKENQEKINEFENQNVNIISSVTGNNNEVVEQPKSLEELSKIANFFVPEGIDLENKDDHRPSNLTYCMVDTNSHPIKLRHLINVNFYTIANSIKANEDVGKSKYLCPICKKNFTNSSKLVILKKCGHVFCLSCLDQNMNMNNNNNSGSNKVNNNSTITSSTTGNNIKSKLKCENEYHCYVCDKEFYGKEDLVTLQSGGSAFSGAGINLEAKK